MSNPVVFDNYYAVGSDNGKEVQAPALGAFALLMPALCTDQVLIPTPLSDDLECFQLGVGQLPSGRRGLFKAVDRNGRILGQVRSYMRPVWEACEKSDSTFPRTAQRALYLLAIANKYHAAGVDVDSNRVLSDFLRAEIKSLSGEAAIRSREVAALFLAYRTVRTSRVSPMTAAPDAQVQSVLIEMVRSAELRDIVVSQGRLGYLKHPRATLSSIGRNLKHLAGRRDFRASVKMAESIATITAGPIAAPLAGVAESALAAVGKMRDFGPPLFELPQSTRLGIVRFALRRVHPSAEFIVPFEWTHPPVRAGPNKCAGTHVTPAFEENHLSRDGFCGHTLCTPRWGPDGPVDEVRQDAVARANDLRAIVAEELLRFSV
jgi:hypothetical protein